MSRFDRVHMISY